MENVIASAILLVVYNMTMVPIRITVVIVVAVVLVDLLNNIVGFDSSRFRWCLVVIVH